MTVGLFLLRAFQMGLRMDDLDGLEYGTVLDMMTEAGNDDCEYQEMASQSDMDRF